MYNNPYNDFQHADNIVEKTQLKGEYGEITFSSCDIGEQLKTAISVREDVLSEALTYVTKNRNSVYGGPEDNFSRIASLANAMFSDKLSEPLTSSDVALFSICIKLGRLQETPSHRDSWVDIAGYAACGAECELKVKE